jgi:predicted RNase H-like nuclease (RuvC/YqgF family)
MQVVMLRCTGKTSPLTWGRMVAHMSLLARENRRQKLQLREQKEENRELKLQLREQDEKIQKLMKTSKSTLQLSLLSI